MEHTFVYITVRTTIFLLQQQYQLADDNSAIMRPSGSGSTEFYTQDEDSDGSYGRRGRSRKRHTHITVPPVGNIFITPANSSSPNKYETIKPEGPNAKKLHNKKHHHHRSRSLSIQIRPVSRPPTKSAACSVRGQQRHQIAQCDTWGPAYNPSSNSCSSVSTSTACVEPSLPYKNAGSNYHVYRPIISENQSQQFCPDQVYQNICNDKGYDRSQICESEEDGALSSECAQDSREASAEQFDADIRFKRVGKLPTPTDVRKLGKHVEPIGENETFFPFKKTPSGNLKIYQQMVAFESPQVAVLVDDPKRTHINFKQSRYRCTSPPPPVPPMPQGSSRGPSPECHQKHKPNDSCPLCSLNPKQLTEMSTKSGTFSTNHLTQQEPAQIVDSRDTQDDDPSVKWSAKYGNQCCSNRDFQESFYCRLQRAVHPDMKVMIGDKEFPCHSIALQAYSHYFDRIKRPRETIHHVKLPEDILSSEDFPSLMDWILLDDASKSRVISCDNVLSLYCASKFLGMPGLRDHCICFLNEKIQAGDPIILQMYERARVKPRCSDLLSSLASKLVQLFPIMYKTKQFLKLGVQELVTLLGSDDIKTQSELQVYDCALRWLFYDWKKRCDDAVRVMKCVRFGLLSPLQLTQIQHITDAASTSDHCRIFAIPCIKKMLQDGLTCAILRENYKSRPSELNKWIEMSHVVPPRPRSHSDPDSDIFEGSMSQQKILEASEELQGPCRMEANVPSLTCMKAHQSDSNTVVRDVCHKDEIAKDTSIVKSEDSTVLKMPSTEPQSPPPFSKPPSPRQPKSKSNLSAARSDNWIDFQNDRDRNDDHGDRERRIDEDKDKRNDDTTAVAEVTEPNLSLVREEPELVTVTSHLQNQLEPPEPKINTFTNHAAELIQSHYHGYIVRRKYLAMRAAAVTIQRAFRSRRKRKAVEEVHTKPLTIPAKDVVLVFGGMNPKEEYSSETNDCQTIYRFNPDENLWASMGKLPEPRSHCGAIVYRNTIYIFGGSDPRKQTDQGKSLPSSKCWRLSPWSGKWEEMASMKVPRTNFACCHFRGKIYAFGGKNSGGEVLSSCERFDPSIKPKGAWNSVMPMPSPCMSMTVAKYGDKLCVIGGVSSARNGVKRPILTSVLIYDPKSNTWTEGTSLEHGRCYSAAASHYNRLYLTGGAGKESDNDRTKSLQDVLCYEDGEWERVGLLKRPRHGHCMVKIGHYFLILGGVSSDTMEPLDSVELFNTQTNRSSSRVANIPHKLTGMSGVVI